MKKERVGIFCNIVLLIIIITYCSLQEVDASSKNGYYNRDTSSQFMFYDAMANYGTPIIDGKASPDEWDKSLASKIYKYEKKDNIIEVFFQYDNNNLYVLFEVDDDKLWDEPGNPSSTTWQDDGIQLCIDANNSRNQYFMNDDRAISMTIGGYHFAFTKGNNIGGYAYYGEESLIRKAISYEGTLNNNSDVDVGYTIEISIPWRELSVASPSPLSVISLNFFVLEDDDGGDLTPIYQAKWRRDKENRISDDDSENLTPIYQETWDGPVDRWYKWFGRINVADSCANGPAHYGRVCLLPPNDVVAPAAISDLTSSYVPPYSAHISFTSPGNDAMTGEAKAYLIRYSDAGPINSENAWSQAQIFENKFIPKIGGKPETLRIIGLKSNTSYNLAVRAVDYNNNIAPLSNNLTFKTGVASSDYGHGNISASPMGRYFVHEDGTAFIPVSEPAGITWVGIKDLYDRDLWWDTEGIFINWSEVELPSNEKAEAFISNLADKGINLIRIFIEDFAFANLTPNLPQGVGFLEYPATGSGYIDETLQFADDFFELCAKYGIHVIAVPFETFFYIDYWLQSPYNIANGGTITTPDQFVTDSTITRDVQKKRYEVLYSVFKKHNNFFGWELMNEWDNDTFASRYFGWELDRIAWMKDLSSYLRTIDNEHMVFISSVILEPYYELKYFLLMSDYFDFVCFHGYSKASDNPIAAGDIDPTIRPAVELGQVVEWLTGTTPDHRPVFDNEFGPIKLETYSSQYTQQMDDENYHNILWAEFASGAAGMPLRWPSKVLEFRGPMLTEEMWDYQKNMSDFFKTTQVGFKSFSSQPWNSNISVSGLNSEHYPVFSTSDGTKGMIYILRNSNFIGQTDALTLQVKGLVDGMYSIEFWDTRSTSNQLTVTNIAAVEGVFNLNLPIFSKDLMITFLSPPQPTISKAVVTTGENITVTIPEKIQGRTFYVGWVSPDGSLQIMESLNSGILFEDTLPAWKGETKVLDLTVDPTFQKGIHYIYLLTATTGVEPLANLDQVQLSVDVFTVQ